MTRNEKILSGVRSGETYDQVAARLGVTRNVVAGVCKRADLRTGRLNDEKHIQSIKIAQRLRWKKATPQQRARVADAVAASQKVRWAATSPEDRAKHMQRMRDARRKTA